MERKVKEKKKYVYARVKQKKKVEKENVCVVSCVVNMKFLPYLCKLMYSMSSWVTQENFPNFLHFYFLKKVGKKWKIW